MGLIDRLRTTIVPPARPAIDNFWPYFNFNGNTYPVGLNQTLLGKEEGPTPGYVGLVQWAYQTNAVVYAVEQVRVQLFAEARFQWQWRGSKQVFTNSDLDILRAPWPNGTTGDLLTRMLLDADLSGDAFVLRSGSPAVLTRLRPDWVTVITDIEPWRAGAEVVGYAYQPGGPASGLPPVTYDVSQVAHFAPSPDPLSPKRGMSWLTPVIREISADIGMTEHKKSFLTNGATPNLIISLDPAISKAAFDQWVSAFQGRHRGAQNAYETMFLGGGAKAEVVGKDLRELDFKLVQGAGETRIAAAAGVPPVIVGLSEGLQAATYSNYGQARRRFADGTMRPLWRNLCGSLVTILNRPGGADLAVDDKDIAFLQDDMKDRAEIQSTNAAAIRSLTDGGYTPDSVIASVVANDLSLLVHSGLWSVQLQPPVPEQPEPEPEPTEPEPDDSAEEETPAARALTESLDILRTMAEREQPAPIVNVTVEAPEPVPPPEPAETEPTVTEIEYDDDGRIVKIVESPA